jgi:enoyl-CoA hydratase/carnithine racemase
MEWCATARVFEAEEALAGGLVRSVHPDDELLPAARAIAAEIVANSAPVSMVLIRQMMWRMLGADHPMEAHKIDSRGIAALGQSPDAYEGVMAFLEKRSPEWKMKPTTDMPDFYPWWQEPQYE